MAFVLPLAIEIVDAWDAADIEVLPAAMRRDGFEVIGAKVSLLRLLVDVTFTVPIKSMV